MSALPEGWSLPAPIQVDGSTETPPPVWMGLQAATEEDIAKLVEAFGPDTVCDELSLVGRNHHDWSCVTDTHYPPKNPVGGVGSEVYELQNVGEGVHFARDAMFYRSAEGAMTYGVPPEAGAYHVSRAGGQTLNVEGPAPESPAAAARGDGTFAWDEEKKWYVVIAPETGGCGG